MPDEVVGASAPTPRSQHMRKALLVIQEGFLVPPAGLEPATRGLKARYSTD